MRAADVLAKNAMELIRKNYFFNLPIRAVTVFAGNLVGDNFSWQMCRDEDYDYLEKIEKLDTSVDLLRERFGDKIIVRASSMPLSESERIRSAFPSFHPEL